MKIELTGVSIQKEYNPCSIKDCDNGASTAVWNLGAGTSQVNTCMMHLKEKIESGEWEVTTHKQEIKRLKGGYE